MQSSTLELGTSVYDLAAIRKVVTKVISLCLIQQRIGFCRNKWYQIERYRYLNDLL